MYRRSMIFVGVALLAIVAVLICVIPRFTKVDITLHATKTNSQGESLGEYEISLQGNRLDYISGNASLDISVSPFDELSQFIPIRNANTNIDGLIKTEPGTDILCVHYSAWDNKTDAFVVYDIGFSPDMDRWIFVNATEGIYYVSSVSGAYTSQELVDYFHSMIPIGVHPS